VTICKSCEIIKKQQIKIQN